MIGEGYDTSPVAPSTVRANVAGGRRTFRRAGIVALVTVNLVLLAVTLAAFVMAPVAVDWEHVYSQLGPKIADGTLYDWPTILVYRYSPVLAYGFAAIAPIGTLLWLGLHFAVLPLLGRRLALITLASFPFWTDVYNGNVLVFVFVAAAVALRGERWAQLTFLALTLLIPRPLMLPVAAWLLWKHRDLWVPFALIFVVHAGLVLATGYGPTWIALLMARGADDMLRGIGPSVILGAWYTPIGLALAAWLTWKGRLGLASVAASPYWLPPYLIFGLLEFTRSGALAPPRRYSREHPRHPDSGATRTARSATFPGS